MPSFNLHDSTLDSAQNVKVLKPIALSYEKTSGPNKRNILQVQSPNKDQMLIKNQGGKYDLKLSLASTP
jgi:hypothetical protein